MNSWNYRIILHDTDDEEPIYLLHEVFYDEEGEISSISESPASPMGETTEELLQDLADMMSDAKEFEVLKLSELDVDLEGFDD